MPGAISSFSDLKCTIPGRVSSQLRKIDLQMIPSAAAEALQLLKNPECSILDLVGCIQRDIQLASRILSVANSPMYAPESPILNLHKAVVYIGQRGCANLIFATGTSAMLKRLGGGEHATAKVLVAHSFSVGAIASELNRRLRLGFQGEEFTAGLLHDVGRLLLFVAMPDEFAQADALNFCETPETLDRERSVFGTEHSEVGCWFGIQNRIPEPILHAIRFHHTPGESPEHADLAAITNAADHIANHLLIAAPEDYDLSTNPGLAQLSDRRETDMLASFSPDPAEFVCSCKEFLAQAI